MLYWSEKMIQNSMYLASNTRLIHKTKNWLTLITVFCFRVDPRHFCDVIWNPRIANIPLDLLQRQKKKNTPIWQTSFQIFLLFVVNPQTARLYFCPHSTRGTPIRRPFLVIDPCFFSNCVCMCSILLFDVPGWPYPWFTHEVPVESVLILLAPGKSSYIKFIFIHIYICIRNTGMLHLLYKFTVSICCAEKPQQNLII